MPEAQNRLFFCYITRVRKSLYPNSRGRREEMPASGGRPYWGDLRIWGEKLWGTAAVHGPENPEQIVVSGVKSRIEKARVSSWRKPWRKDKDGSEKEMG